MIKVRATPGHTKGCVTYVTRDAPDQPQPRMPFTRDTLLVHGCERTNFSGLYKEGLLGEALAMKSKMEENGCFPDAITFEVIICALLEKDENDMAEKLLREMIAKGIVY
ncbi:hypothetical protein VNO78_26958 [Psophocarpus tetragonolobus]|uniref:Pentatricopeptide repeat-containing protein n=1 Tax=Psophocarpus tetragonolobus TaxID=3891 RepID=A0AAN9XBD7_PSOTE